MKHRHPLERPRRAWEYEPPLSKLLSLGNPYEDERTNYLAVGLSSADIPQLIRMATDPRLLDLRTNTAHVWAPVHAWLALGQLRAVEAIQPLLSLFQRIDGDAGEWVSEGMLDTFTAIGPAAMPAVSAYLADPTHGKWSRLACAEILGRIGRTYPEARAACIDALTRQLESFTANVRDVNGMLIWSLIDLKAVEAAPLIERAFAADAVPKSMVGDWEEVQVDLGLKAHRDTPQPHYLAEELGVSPDELKRMQESAMFRGTGRTHNDPWQAEKRKHSRKKHKR
jgi:hypothetical protein